jgi:hypothetical protein
MLELPDLGHVSGEQSLLNGTHVLFHLARIFIDVFDLSVLVTYLMSPKQITVPLRTHICSTVLQSWKSWNA